MHWRKINKSLHRDIGYLSVALVIIYSLSGIAVNHINDWNPNYIITKTTHPIAINGYDSLSVEQISSIISEKLNISDSLVSSFRSSPDKIDLFYDRKTIKADLLKGISEMETVENRPVFRLTNFLHLNVPKKLWTWVADIFAGCLILLALTGMFMLKGKNGIEKRGKWFVGLGLLIPVIFWIIYF